MRYTGNILQFILWILIVIFVPVIKVKAFNDKGKPPCCLFLSYPQKVAEQFAPIKLEEIKMLGAVSDFNFELRKLSISLLARIRKSTIIDMRGLAMTIELSFTGSFIEKISVNDYILLIPMRTGATNVVYDYIKIPKRIICYD